MNENELEENTKNVNVDIKSQTINKAISIVSDSTKLTRNTIDNTTSKGINKFVEFLKSTPLGIKIDTYIAERPYKLEKAMEQMKAKYENIPSVNRKEPSSYIAFKVAHNLNYCLDEDYMKNMFINLLISDMDTQKSSRITPSLVELINSLSHDDAIFLDKLNKKNLRNSIPIIYLKLEDKKTHNFSIISKNIICLPEDQYIPIPETVLDNLLRLRIVEILFDQYLSNNTDYDKVFNLLKSSEEYSKYKELVNKELSYKKQTLQITSLGKTFIDICLP